MRTPTVAARPGQAEDGTAWSRVELRALAALVIAGTALRLRELLHDRSLWRDEASLVFNLRTRGVLGFTEPLDHDQGTPPGFFVLAQTIGRALGGSELAYRFVPFAASCVGLAVVAVLVRRHLPPVCGLVAVALLALSGTLVYYGAEVKQYSTDMAVAALVWLAADAGARAGWSRRATVVFGAAGAVALLTSYPAAFVLPPLGVLAFVGARRDPSAARRLVLVGAAWAAVFAGSYLGWARDLNRSDLLQDYWSEGFLPVPPTSIDDLEQWRKAVGTLVSQLLSPSAVGPLALLAVLGTIWLARRKPPIAAVLGAPVVLTVIASMLSLYPAIERSLLFILPASAVAVGAGVESLSGLLRDRDPVYRWAPAVALVTIAASPAIARAADPPEQEELRPLLRELAGAEHGATVLVTDTAEVGWLYYADRLGLDPRRVVVREFPRGDGGAAREVAREVDGERDLWLVDVAFWRPVGALDPDLTSALDGVGRRRSEHHATGASVYRYDLSD